MTTPNDMWFQNGLESRTGLLDLLLQHPEFLCVEEYDQCDLQPVAELFDGYDAKITEKQRNAERIDLFIHGLEQAGEAFTEDLWCIMVDKVTASLQGGMMFLPDMRDGC